MPYKTAYSALKTMDCWFGGQSITAPATLYLSLTTTVPTKAAAGTPVAWTGYARLAVTNNLTNFPSTDPKTNGATFIWASAVPSGEGPKTIVGVDFYDAASGGNRIGFGVPTSRTLVDGDIYHIAAGMMNITEI